MIKTASPAATRIRILPEVVQNQIAAGEVVERPASLVKELVENALDAGARRISIELEQGGQQLVRVVDDGCGMSEADLILAVERHATSKIADVDDIFAVQTLGFRGEALPSIGSVSRMTIYTCPPEAATGYQLVAAGGKTLRVCPCPPRPGTVIEVRDLFFNTPARRKFMKRPAAEVAAVSETVTRLALAHPEVAWRIENGGKLTLELPRHGSLAERLAALFGRELAARLLPVAYTAVAGLKLEGFVACPPESRANSRGIYTFINRRWIRHPGLARALADAYRGSLPPRRYPFAVLYLQLDPGLVDVNVHPTKEEVRFENDRLVIGSVHRAVSEALAGQPKTVAAPAGHEEPRAGARGPRGKVGESAAGAAAIPVRPDEAGIVAKATAMPKPAESGAAVPNDPAPVSPLSAAAIPEKDVGVSPARSGGLATPKRRADSDQAVLPLEPGRRHKVLAQAGQRYLVVECATGIKLVDQHALHERWNYESLRNRSAPLTSQRLLLPAVVELSPAEAARFEEALPILRELGFEVEVFGLATLSVSATPELVKPGQVEAVIRDVFADLEAGGRQAVAAVRDTILKSLACRAAVLFGTHLPPEQLLDLMDKFEAAGQPLTCPHGRPTTVTITWEELERRFGRTGGRGGQ